MFDVVVYFFAPGVLVAARSRADAGTAGRTKWRAFVHEVLFGESVLLLVGGLAIGAVAGAALG